MRSPWISLVVSLVGCGATPARRPPMATATATPAPVVASAATTCADVGVLLRGPVGNELDRDAGAARATAIAKACEAGKWSAAVLHCIADTPKDAAPCLEKLDDAQRELFDKNLIAWAEAFPGEMPGGDEPSEAYVDCDDGVGDVAMYAPALVLGGSDADFAVGVRRHEIVHLCNLHEWDVAVRQCMQLATDPQSVAACEAKLPPDELAALAVRLGELDKLVAATFEKRKHAPDCKRVVAVHYADAAWKGKIDGLVPKDRKKVIADSRAQMAKSCAIEAWDATVRACVVAGGDDLCFATTGYPWDYPASGVLASSTGIADCDKYIAAMNRTLTCQKLPQASRDAFKESFAAMRDAITPTKITDEATKKQIGESCRYGAEALDQVLASNGC